MSKNNKKGSPSKNTNKGSRIPVVREWTLMFYFASDNPLAPSIVSQLKSIKDAGFHPEVNVIARFDPHTENTPSHIFEVNLINKLKEPNKHRIGRTPNDPFVRNLVADKLWGNDAVSKSIKDRIRESMKSAGNGNADGYNPPAPPPEPTGRRELPPAKALKAFLKFCQEEYPARNYILFLLGHGLVVGNDLFLFDENAFQQFPATPDVGRPSAQAAADGDDSSSEGRKGSVSPQNSLSLRALGEVLADFNKKITKKKEGEKGELQLVSFHSCSMSGVEVAYELEGKANYMLASQGPAFVGSFPYRSILIRIFNDLVERKSGAVDIKDTLIKIFFYCLYNSFDFQLAGYSFDLCLCNLKKVSDLNTSLSALAQALVRGLEYEADPLAKDLILLAHWDAQSFWQEAYHDLYDYCLRLRVRCLRAQAGTSEMLTILEDIVYGCEGVLTALKRGQEGADDGLIVRSAFAGAAYQYSHGLSVFFPWSEPVGSALWEDEYEHFSFNQKTSWKKFLQTYFDITQRKTRADEVKANEDPNPEPERDIPLDEELLGLLETISTRVFNTDGQLSGDPIPGGKTGSTDPTGSDCGCPTIKNYPFFTAVRDKRRADKEEKKGKELKEQPFSPAFLEQHTKLD